MSSINPISGQPISSTPASLGAQNPVVNTQQPVTNGGNASIQTGFDPTPVTGGGVSDFANDAVSKLMDFAQKKSNLTDAKMEQLMASGKSDISELDVQKFKRDYDQSQALTQIAKAMADNKKERIQIWLR